MFPKQETIAEKLGISLSSVKRAVKELSKANIILVELKFSNRYNLTSSFFEVINMTPDAVQIELPKCQNEPNHDVTEKEQNIKQKKNFSFKNLLELSNTNTIKYYQEINKLSEGEKQHLCKIKLGRAALTDFQKINLDKFIMLNDYEIQKVNSLEPYYKQENIDLFYTARMRKIRKIQEQSQKSKLPMPADQKTEVLSMLKVGYKAFSKNKRQLVDFLQRNKSKMDQYGITESELCANV
jgi:DNA-binding Lrp family transcriptional regulator